MTVIEEEAKHLMFSISVFLVATITEISLLPSFSPNEPKLEDITLR